MAAFLSRSAMVNSTVPSSGQQGLGRFLGLEEGAPEGVGEPRTSPVERISGLSTGSTSGNMLNGKTASLTP